MNNEFIPQELESKIIKLGFNRNKRINFIENGSRKDYKIYFKSERQTEESKYIKWIGGILWQQAFDFFREKYNLNSYIKYQGIYGYYYVINYDEYGNDEENCGFHYEEARLKCLTKLIEIVENEK